MATKPNRHTGKEPEQPKSGARPLVLAGLVLGLGYLLRKFIGKGAPTPVAGTPPHPDGVPTKPASPHPGYESRDISVGWVFGIVAFLAISGIAIHFALAGLLNHLYKQPAVRDVWRPVSRPAGGLVAPVATYPKLQVAPPFDLQNFRAREEEQLNTYGWVNRSSGVVHIPVTAAMDLLLKRGLPVRQGAAASEGRGPSTYELQLQRVEQRGTQGGAP